MYQTDEILSIYFAVGVDVGCFGMEVLHRFSYDMESEGIVVGGIEQAVGIDVAGLCRLRIGEEEVVGLEVGSAERRIVLAAVEEGPGGIVGHFAARVAAQERPGDGIAPGVSLRVGCRGEAVAGEQDGLAGIYIYI